MFDLHQFPSEILLQSGRPHSKGTFTDIYPQLSLIQIPQAQIHPNTLLNLTFTIRNMHLQLLSYVARKAFGGHTLKLYL